MNIDKNKLVSARENALMNQFELSQASKVDLSLIRRLESIGGATRNPLPKNSLLH